MKHIFLTLLLLTGLALTTVAQTQQTPKQPSEIDSGFDLHQIYLDQPVKSIEKIEYDQDGTPIEGEISPDGKRIILKNYTHKGRIYVSLTYQDGTTDEFKRSSCVIDPVAPL